MNCLIKTIKMLKQILNLEKTSILKKEEQKTISGGAIFPEGVQACVEDSDCNCDEFPPIIPSVCISARCQPLF